MCGIAAISVPMDARVNARELTHALLASIESRGTHASGFAFYGADGEFGYYKNPKPGSQLSLAELPRDAKTVIIHTRYATQGDRMDNRNNHPVMSTDNQIALVHNGVISNDFGLRPDLGITRAEHGEVDSLVIPSLIAQQGVKALNQLAGYAAIAWLDGREDGELHIARLKSSPVAYTHLFDGTFVMASTEHLLEDALLTAGYDFGGVFDLAEGRMIEVQGGIITEHEAAPRMTYDHYSYGRFSSATAGGQGAQARHTVTKIRGSESDLDPVYEDEEVEDSCELTVEHYREDLAKWAEKQAERDLKMQQRDLNTPMVDFGDTPTGGLIQDLDAMSDADWEEMIGRMAEEEIETEDALGEYLSGEGFYIIDGDGGVTHHPILEDLEARLRWLSKMTRQQYDIFSGVEDELNWVNQIMDLGSVSADGDLVSWVDDAADIDNFESPAVNNLRQLREGALMLSTLKGA